MARKTGFKPSADFLVETRTSTLVRKKLELERDIASLQAQLTLIDVQLKSKLGLGYYEEVKVEGTLYRAEYSYSYSRKTLDRKKLNEKFGKTKVDTCLKTIDVNLLTVKEIKPTLSRVK